jgi:hypothetical protein
MGGRGEAPRDGQNGGERSEKSDQCRIEAKMTDQDFIGDFECFGSIFEGPRAVAGRDPDGSGGRPSGMLPS